MTANGCCTKPKERSYVNKDSKEERRSRSSLFMSEGEKLGSVLEVSRGEIWGKAQSKKTLGFRKAGRSTHHIPLINIKSSRGCEALRTKLSRCRVVGDQDRKENKVRKIRNVVGEWKS